MTKKQGKSLLVTLVCLLIAVFCALPTYAATTSRVGLSTTLLNLDSGSRAYISLRGNVNKLKLEWTTSNKNVVDIDDCENGSCLLEGVNTGTAVVTAKYLGKSYKCKVTVSAPYMACKIGTKVYKSKYLKSGADLYTTIRVDKKNVKTGQLRLFNAKNTYADYESDDPDVVKVSSKGVLTFTGIGSTEVEVRFKNKYLSEDDALSESYVRYILKFIVTDSTPAKLVSTYVKAERANYTASNKRVKEILKYINEANKDNGFKPVVLDSRLSHAAGYLTYYAGGSRNSINNWFNEATSNKRVFNTLGSYKYRASIDTVYSCVDGYSTSNARDIAYDLLRYTQHTFGLNATRVGIYVTSKTTFLIAD